MCITETNVNLVLTTLKNYSKIIKNFILKSEELLRKLKSVTWLKKKFFFYNIYIHTLEMCIKGMQFRK